MGSLKLKIFVVLLFVVLIAISSPYLLTISRFFNVDLSSCSNSDYHRNPFVPAPQKGKDHFPELKPGIFLWPKVPFHIAEPYSETGRPSVITTGENPYFSCTLPLKAEPTRALHLAVDGVWIGKQPARVARLEIHYEDGSKTEKILVANEDVWSYGHLLNRKDRIPKSRILWQSPSGQKLTGVTIPLDRKKIPKQLEISAMPAGGIKGYVIGVSFFAITQEKAGGG